MSDVIHTHITDIEATVEHSSRNLVGCEGTHVNSDIQAKSILINTLAALKKGTSIEVQSCCLGLMCEYCTGSARAAVTGMTMPTATPLTEP
jgi:hypothetical protein